MERSAGARSAERAFPARLASRSRPLRSVQITAQHISASTLREVNSALAVHELSSVVQCRLTKRNVDGDYHDTNISECYDAKRCSCIVILRNHNVGLCVSVLMMNITFDCMGESH